jgi:type II secretion system protein E
MEAFAAELGLEFIRLEGLQIDQEVLKAVPAKHVTNFKLFPVRILDDSVYVATAEPLNLQSLDDMRMALRRDVEPVVSTAKDIDAAIKKWYGIGADTIQEMSANEQEDDLGVDIEMPDVDIDSDDAANDATIVRFVNQFIAEAVRDRATDIHVEPLEDELRIRYRIDGMLYEAQVPPAIKKYQSAIISRLKIMANLDIAERRLPQDGKIKVKSGSRDFDLRVATMPTPYGESIVIRILSRDTELINLEKLGLDNHNATLLRGMITKPHGVILVTGPTGSGKSTTLYASLTELNNTDSKIITIEDPIEYRMRGVTQVQVQPDIGLDFARVLRTILRQDPDIIMVGETRDTETAQNTIRAALTGHLVFTTLHTNDACSAVTRLLDMGMEPFLVASSVEGIVAQRLVRRLCPECKVPADHDPSLAETFNISPEEVKEANLYKPVGCEKCRYTGYSGRTAVYEIVRMNEALRRLVVQNTPASTLRKVALEHGMRTIRLDGWEKVKVGLTTVDEVIRVTMEEELMNEVDEAI